MKIASCRSQSGNVPLCTLQFRDAAGKEIGSKKCYLIGSDGGIIPNADKHPLPAAGLMTDVAYRWDIVCDFTGYTDKVCTLLCVKANAPCYCQLSRLLSPLLQMLHGLTQLLACLCRPKSTCTTCTTPGKLPARPPSSATAT